MRVVTPKAVVQTLASIVCAGLLLFLPAGTLAWPQAWIFLALFAGCSQAIGVWLLKTDPALLAERMRWPFGGDQKPRDQAVMGRSGPRRSAPCSFSPPSTAGSRCCARTALPARRYGCSRSAARP